MLKRLSAVVQLMGCLMVGLVGLATEHRAAFGQVYFREVIVEKRCGHCGKPVPLSSRPGQRCPHCGVYWGGVRKKYIGGVQYIDQPQPWPREITVHYNGEKFECPYLERSGSLFVPLRFFSEKLGFSVQFTPPRDVSLSNEERRIELQVWGRKAKVYQGDVSREEIWPTASFFQGDTIYVPLRAIAEALGFLVDYRGTEIYLTKAGPPVSSPSGEVSPEANPS